MDSFLQVKNVSVHCLAEVMFLDLTILWLLKNFSCIICDRRSDLFMLFHDDDLKIKLDISFVD